MNPRREKFPRELLLLPDYGAELEATDKRTCTALMIAADYGSGEAVHQMLDYEVDIDAKDFEDQVSLHYAARSGSVNVVQLLLSEGLKVDFTDKYGLTPLHAVQLASTFGSGKDYRAVAELLLHNGARMDTENKDGETPLSIAMTKGDKSMIDLLEAHPANFHKSRKHPLEADYDHGSLSKRVIYE